MPTRCSSCVCSISSNLVISFGAVQQQLHLQCSVCDLQQRSFSDNGNSAVRLCSAATHLLRQRQQHLRRSISIQQQRQFQLRRLTHASVSATALASCNDGSNSFNFNVQHQPQQRLYAQQHRRSDIKSTCASTSVTAHQLLQQLACASSPVLYQQLLILGSDRNNN